MQNTQLIPFAGGEIEAALGPDGRPYVNVRRVCEDLGINPDSQIKRLKKEPWGTTVEMTVVAGDGKQRSMIFLRADRVPTWAVKISARHVHESLRPRLEAYQVEAAEVLAAHFMPPQALAPVATGSDVLATLSGIQSTVAASLEAIQGLGTVAVDHEHRLRALESKPAVSVVVKTKKGQAERLLVRWIARFREEADVITEYMTPDEKRAWYREVNGRLKGAFGDKHNWTNPNKFYEGARWLLKNYGLDITDIEDPT